MRHLLHSLILFTIVLISAGCKKKEEAAVTPPEAIPPMPKDRPIGGGMDKKKAEAAPNIEAK